MPPENRVLENEEIDHTGKGKLDYSYILNERLRATANISANVYGETTAITRFMLKRWFAQLNSLRWLMKPDHDDKYNEVVNKIRADLKKVEPRIDPGKYYDLLEEYSEATTDFMDRRALLREKYTTARIGK